MSKTFDIRLSITVRKPTKDECYEHGIDQEDVDDFDFDGVGDTCLVEHVDEYFENCLDEIVGEILADSGLPIMITKIKADVI